MQVDYGADKIKPLRHRMRRHLLQLVRVSSSPTVSSNCICTGVAHLLHKAVVASLGRLYVQKCNCQLGSGTAWHCALAKHSTSDIMQAAC
jgi:hypothetical protein